jgi:hypothetical protein
MMRSSVVYNTSMFDFTYFAIFQANLNALTSESWASPGHHLRRNSTCSLIEKRLDVQIEVEVLASGAKVIEKLENAGEEDEEIQNKYRKSINTA